MADSLVYGSRWAAADLPSTELAEAEMPSRTAYKLIHDQLQLDGTPALNLASFVTTSMDDEAEKLMLENLSKNMVDYEEYPELGVIEKRCVNIIGDLFHAPKDEHGEVLGVSTVGSSEAIILGVLAAKRRWQIARKAAGKSIDKPNIVMSAAVQVCWEKAARYLEVEEKYWNVRPGQYVADPKELVDLVDENTILVCVIVGTTYTGQYEDVEAIDKLLAAKNKEKGFECKIHVDGASGGFVVPFIQPDLKWDFRCSQVVSINTSGHKYGLSYAGVGWVIFRGKEWLPKEITFSINYLGAPQISLTLNFSKSGIQVIAQYYVLCRLGKDGYRSIFENLTQTSDFLSDAIMKIGGGNLFELMSATGGKGLPLVAWKLKKAGKYDEFDIARTLRSKGWIVPAYTMAPGCEKLKMMRIVIRVDFTKQRADDFLHDLQEAVQTLEDTPAHIIEHEAKKIKPKSAKHENALHRGHVPHHEKTKNPRENPHLHHQKAQHGIC